MRYWLFDIWDVVAGPLNGSFVKGTKWIFEDYAKVSFTFKMVLKLNSEDEYARLFRDCMAKELIDIFPYVIQVVIASFLLPLLSFYFSASFIIAVMSTDAGKAFYSFC